MPSFLKTATHDINTEHTNKYPFIFTGDDVGEAVSPVTHWSKPEQRK